jgi:hypothetical protein
MSVAGFAGRDGALPTANTQERGRGPLPVNRRLEGNGRSWCKADVRSSRTTARPADNVTTYIEAGRNELDRRPNLISNRVLLNPLSKPERM